MQNENLDGVARGIGRRSFVKRVGLTGIGLAGATLMAGKLNLLEKVEAGTITDVDILNFALNLEYLEAEFYTIATTGKRIDEVGIGIDGKGNAGPTTGGKKVDFSGDFSKRLGAIVNEITYDEQQHVILLRAALGSDAVAKPAIDLDALGIGFANFKEFLVLSRAFEDAGESAYGGAAPLITSKAYLSEAVRIGLTEAQHASNIRLLVAENGVKVTPLDALDRLPPPSGPVYFQVNKFALTIVRTVSQVLAIVYANSTPGTNKGGFFPNGVNGNINTV